MMFGWCDDGYKDVACCVFINRVLGIGYPDMCDECVCEYYNFGVLEAPGTDILDVLAMVSAITRAVLLQKASTCVYWNCFSLQWMTSRMLRCYNGQWLVS